MQDIEFREGLEYRGSFQKTVHIFVILLREIYHVNVIESEFKFYVHPI